MQPHTPAALGFTTGPEAQCGVAAHVQRRRWVAFCAGRAHCGGVAVGGAAAEDALAESEAPLAPRVRLGGRTVRTVRTGCQLLLTLARRQLRRSPRSLAPRVRQDAAVLPANPGRRSDSDTFVPRISWYKCVHICTTHFFSSLFLGGYCFVCRVYTSSSAGTFLRSNQNMQSSTLPHMWALTQLFW